MPAPEKCLPNMTLRTLNETSEPSGGSLGVSRADQRGATEVKPL